MRVVDLQKNADLFPEVRQYFQHVSVRVYQADLANKLFETLTTKVRVIVIEAPTGLGKWADQKPIPSDRGSWGILNERPSQTAAVGAAVKAMTEEVGGLRVLWLTRTAAEVAHVARELSGIGACPFYGRRVLCILDPVSRVDESMFTAACRAVRVSHRCPYWPGRPQKLSLGSVTVTELKEIGKVRTTCPYELQLKSIPSTSFLVATHRQLQAVGWLLGRWRARKGTVLLVIDEAQGLLQGALGMVRDEISLTTLLRASKEAEKYGFPELSRQLREAAKKYEEIADTANGEVEVDDLLPDWEELLLVGEEIQERKLRAGYVPAVWLLRVADLKTSLGGEKPLLTREGKTIKLLALQDPVEHLRRVLEGWSKIVLMSATISGELIESLLGEEITLFRAGWPTGADEDEGPDVTVYLVSGLTTKFEARDEVMIERVQRLLAEVAEKARSHGWGVLVFFPSHELLEWTKETMTTNSNILLWEARGASQEEVDSLVREFTSRQGQGRVLCGVAGGRLAEGVDLPADLVIILGVPFAPPSPRQERLIRRLSEVVGDKERAWRYAVALPAVWKVVQAAGRAVRGPEDSAIILLVDDRYQHLRPLFPR
jgi:DNA excision repair protein ERCC-2